MTLTVHDPPFLFIGKYRGCPSHTMEVELGENEVYETASSPFGAVSGLPLPLLFFKHP